VEGKSIWNVDLLPDGRPSTQKSGSELPQSMRFAKFGAL
jgi:hypothetical protein